MKMLNFKISNIPFRDSPNNFIHMNNITPGVEVQQILKGKLYEDLAVCVIKIQHCTIAYTFCLISDILKNIFSCKFFITTVRTLNVDDSPLNFLSRII